MMKASKLFYKYSQPLKEITHPEEGEIYYNLEGHALKYRGEGVYQFIEGSPLNEEFLITGLTPKQLSLFWKLVKNKSIHGINIV